MLNIFMYNTPIQFLFNQTSKQSKINIVDPDQLASEKPADLDLHCFQNRIYPSLV